MATINKTEVENIIYGYFRSLMGLDFSKRIIVADEGYESIDVKWVIDCIKTDPILIPANYKKDVFDCDDYVLYLKTKVSLYAQNKFSTPLAVGFILTQLHAFNFSIDAYSKLFLINTQSDERKTTNNKNDFNSFLELSSDNIIQLIYL